MWYEREAANISKKEERLKKKENKRKRKVKYEREAGARVRLCQLASEVSASLNLYHSYMEFAFAIAPQTIIHVNAPQTLPGAPSNFESEPKYWLPLPISSSEVSESGLMCFMICEQRRRREGAKSAGENATEFGKNKRRRKKYLQNRWWGKSNQKMPPNFAETKKNKRTKNYLQKRGWRRC